MSADQGNAFGQYNYGICLNHGQGIAKNLSEATRYFKMSADQGNADAQNGYGICLKNGEGVAKNLSEAARYFKMSADQGNGDADKEYHLCRKELSASESISVADGIIDLQGFKNVRELGRGRFGIVWLTENKNNEILAVKYIEVGPTFDSGRLLREVSVLTSLNHPCIVRIAGWSLPNEECRKARIATEFMINGSVEDALVRVKKGDIPRFWTHTNITKMMIGVVLGMKYLHSRNIIHRDLKPGNLLIDENGQIRIADFGTAKLEDCGTTTDVIGTLAYMAPEALDGSGPTKKFDVFAFGLIIYEILVGESVFPKTGSALQIAGMHVKGIRPDIPKGIHGSVGKLIQQCWSNNPEDRPTFDKIFDKLERDWFPFFKDVDHAACEAFIASVRSEESRTGNAK
jgi:serine/threonine protein kinase